MNYLLCLAVGLVAGIFSGLLGVGGGAILVPAMVYIFGMTQHQAQGTTLGVLLPPVFLFATWQYYKAGHVNVPIAAVVAIGLMIGAFLGAYWAQGIADVNLKRTFGIIIILFGIKMII